MQNHIGATKPATEIFNNDENIDKIEKVDSFENIDRIQAADCTDSMDISENKENNDPKNLEKNYISLYNQSERQEIDNIDEAVSKPNSITLGEVREALNNGLLYNILPVGGPVYKVNSLNDANNIEFSANYNQKSSETRVNILIEYYYYYINILMCKYFV